MLTKIQENYLSRLPQKVLDTPVKVLPWQQEGLDIANKIINEINAAVPRYKVIFIGSMALHIAGQKDIDLSVLCPAKDFSEPRKVMEKLLGEPDRVSLTHISWHFVRDGYEIGLYLTDPIDSKVQEQIDIHNLLKNNPQLLREYEELKIKANGLPYREYQIRKYNFYNQLLGVKE